MSDPGQVPQLRVIDFGEASPLQSQTLWHAVGYGVSAGAPATLSFVRPASAYVGIGYHRHLDEVDEKYCRAEGLPIYRRMIGGGPVYLDAGQLFFQICLPVSAVSPSRLNALRSLLSPALVAFRVAGVPVELDETLELTVDGAKVCGHGAGQIEQAIVVCGNLIETFDYERATRVIRVPNDEMAGELGALMRESVRATPADPETFKQAMIAAYAVMLGARAWAGELDAYERRMLHELDERFTSQEWLTGSRPAMRSDIRQVKVKSGRWVFHAGDRAFGLVASVDHGVVRRARVHAVDPSVARNAAALERLVTGVALSEVTELLHADGGPGTAALAELVQRADERTV